MDQTVLNSEASVLHVDALNEQAMNLLNSDVSATLEKAKQALTLSESAHDGEVYLKGRAIALLVLGAAHYRRTEHDHALNLSKQAITICEHLQELRWMTFGLNTIGATYITIGEYDKALETHLKSLGIREDIHDDHGVATSLMNVGNVYYHLGDYAKALDYYLRSLSLREQIQDVSGVGTSLANIASVYTRLGDNDAALDYLLKSASIKEQTDNKHGLGQTLVDVAASYLLRSNTRTASEYAHRSYDISVEIGNKVGQAAALHMIASIEEQNGQNEHALNFYRRALDLRRSIANHQGEVESAVALGRLLCKVGDAHEAESHLRAALALAEEMKSTAQLYSVYAALAQCAELQYNLTDAIRYLKLYHEFKEKVFNEESDKKAKNLQALHRVEQAKHEAEIYRLRSVELSAANQEILRQQDILSKQAQELHQRNSELQLLVDEKNELLAIVAHDLKNPLTGIIINTSNVQRNHSRMSTEDIVRQVIKIEETAKRMKEITLNLLDHHAIESNCMNLNIKVENICECIQQVVERMLARADAKSIALHLDVESAVMNVMADHSALLQILENLVSNALKFSPPVSDVTIRCVRENDAMVRVDVEDQGPGISSEDQKQLFKKFARLSARPTAGEESTGLGLSIVHKLVEAQKGSIKYSTSSEGGSIFRVYLPKEK